MTLRAAREYVNTNHRHHRAPQGGLFAVACELDGKVIGCAIVGKPVARMLNDGRTAEITRLCTDGTRNACSFLYRVCVRVARSMGYERVLTYTLGDESGASLRGAAFAVTRKTRPGPRRRSRWLDSHGPARPVREVRFVAQRYRLTIFSTSVKTGTNYKCVAYSEPRPWSPSSQLS